MFEACQISVLIDGHYLLKRVSIQIAPGKVVAVLGPNGAGKSTLVKVMCGEWVPSEGTIWIDGYPIADLTPVECAKQRAILPQQSFLTFPFRVLDVVLMGRFPHVKGIESARDYEIAQEALKRVGVAHLEQRVYPTLSGGGATAGAICACTGPNLGQTSHCWAIPAAGRTNDKPGFVAPTSGIATGTKMGQQ